jgi:hypothetical protein
VDIRIILRVKLLINVIDIATRCRFDGSWFELRWIRDFPHSYRPFARPTFPPVKYVWLLFPGLNRPGRGFNHPHCLELRLKKE